MATKPNSSAAKNDGPAGPAGSAVDEQQQPLNVLGGGGGRRTPIEYPDAGNIYRHVRHPAYPVSPLPRRARVAVPEAVAAAEAPLEVMDVRCGRWASCRRTSRRWSGSCRGNGAASENVRPTSADSSEARLGNYQGQEKRGRWLGRGTEFAGPISLRGVGTWAMPVADPYSSSLDGSCRVTKPGGTVPTSTWVPVG
ncbi:hypothetical protein LX36DRAFT_704913 [Colletotrichum falcatum]|nr:hypothetical protein LX36DRAFT_704913 [Colletotrichum falcatum]